MRALGVLVAAGALTTCARDAAGPGRRASLAVEAVLPASPDLAAFNLTIDNVRLIVVRPPADTAFDATFPFLTSLDSLELSAEITLQQSPETFQVTIQMLSGTTLLFSGTLDVTLSESSNPPTQVPVSYAGPGQNIATLTIGPLDSVVTQGGVLQFRATPGRPQSLTPISWTTSDRWRPRSMRPGGSSPLTRSTVTVQRTPNNVTATTPITVVPWRRR
jgi:hypothetical protein